MANNVNDIMIAIQTFFNFMLKEKNKLAKEIEQSLFKLIFNPIDYGSLRTTIYSVYSIHDTLLTTDKSFFNFKSSTGSGKTRCAPFFFSIKSIKDDLKRPFFIMTQPSRSIINDKVCDFKKHLKNQVEIVIDIGIIYNKYKEIEYNGKNKFSKPIIALLSSINLLKLIIKTQKKGINIFKYTRFCLDEIHERSVEFDVLIAILSNEMNKMKLKKENFPLQILMMSATPDDRILKCFDEVNKIELPDSHLFPVETKRIWVDSRSEVNPEVIDQTFDIIKRMASNNIDYGHILIFTSGNARMNDIQHRIIKDCSRDCSTNYCKVVVISNFDSLIRNSSIQDFYDKLDGIIQKETQSNGSNSILFVLPIKYLGYASYEQKEIGKNPIQNHPNVIKVIMATNAIESSITINSLAAVVDTGLFNHASFNKINGLTNLIEEPISIQSQTQRKGRVGQVRPGICVQIEISGTCHPDKLPPAIQTFDITLNILSLRKIGIKLEEISNLPDKINPNEMKQFISELIKINALVKSTGDINAYGNCLTNFSMVSPFIASAILSVSGYPSDRIFDISNTSIQQLTKKELSLLLAILISYIFSSPDLYVNAYSKKLQEYFDKRSDIITLLQAFLMLAPLSSKEIQNKATEYGFNAQNVIRIKGQMQQISENLFKFNSKTNHESSKDEIISKYIVLFTKLNDYVVDLIRTDKLYDFIQNLIEKIGQNKPEWLISRSVEFNRIEEANYEPSFVYKATHPLLDYEKESFVFLKMRPGSVGLDCPGYGFILNITIAEVKGEKLKFGTIIHTNKTKEISDFIPHPVSLETSEVLENNFSEPMINGYLTDYLNYLNPIYLYRKKYEQNEKTIWTFKTNNYCNEEMHYYFSFIPKNENGIKYFKEAISSIEKLMPYTPSTILIKSTDSTKIISLHGSEETDIKCTRHIINNDYFAYKINTQTINYLCHNIDNLNSNQDKNSIAITGEYLSFSLDNPDRNKDMNSCSGYYPMPYVSQESKYVFYDRSKYQSQLVFVSNENIREFSSFSLHLFSDKNEKESRNSSNNSNINDIRDYSIYSFENIKSNDESFFLEKANSINSKIINFKSESSLLVFTLPSSKLISKGDIEINDSDLLPSSVAGNISHMFYNYASKYIDSCTLKKPLNFDGFL